MSTYVQRSTQIRELIYKSVSLPRCQLIPRKGQPFPNIHRRNTFYSRKIKNK